MDTGLETSQKAWKLREEGKVIEALAIWNEVYFEYLEDKNWERAISVLIDISICWKILGDVKKKKQYYKTAAVILKHIRHLAEKQNIPLRNDYDYHMAGVQSAAGEYHNAISSYEHYLAKIKTPEEEANIKAAIGFAKAKGNSKKEGIQMLRESIALFEESTKRNEFQGKDVFKIWKLGAMLKLAQVLDNKKEAKALAEKALAEATEKGLGARAKQAKALLENLQ
jgi:hypothetical protein